MKNTAMVHEATFCKLWYARISFIRDSLSIQTKVRCHTDSKETDEQHIIINANTKVISMQIEKLIKWEYI